MDWMLDQGPEVRKKQTRHPKTKFLDIQGQDYCILAGQVSTKSPRFLLSFFSPYFWLCYGTASCLNSVPNRPRRAEENQVQCQLTPVSGPGDWGRQGFIEEKC